MDESQVQDICRVCRSEATPEKPLYHPCICTGSIKFIHQECLLQWLKYSRKEYCELCSHRFSFMPIYSPDMPKRLPIKDIVSGLLCSLGTAVRFWLHYTLVAVAWLGIVPLTACRIYRCLFTGSISSIITLPFDILSTFYSRENILADSLYGCFVVTCTLCAFISLVWLREQIIHGGGPEWLEHEHEILHIIEPPADNPNNNVPNAPPPPPAPLNPPPPIPAAEPTNVPFSIHNHPSSSSSDQHEQPTTSAIHQISSDLDPHLHSSEEYVHRPSSSQFASGSLDFSSLESSRHSTSPPGPSHLSSSDFVHVRLSSTSPPPGPHSSSPHDSSSSPPLSSVHSRRSSLPNEPRRAELQVINPNIIPLSTLAVNAARRHQAANLIPHANSDDEQNNAVIENDEDDEVDANEGNNGAEDVNNWNPIEWDHAAEELTWERLLGLDGSLVFLEHVFWVVSLNTLFIVVFAFLPYHIGLFALTCFGFKDYIKTPDFEGLLTTLFGYINIGIVLAILHGVAALIRLNKTRRLLGICYVVIKVSLLSVIEIGIFPLVCGWWLDICSLTLLDATIQDRETGFKLAPGTSMFIHWLVGMVYVFYFASFILLLREVLRPGVLWFLKNLNDPDFNPIQEMIHSPILRHIRRVLISLVTFGTTILLVVWLPVRIIEKLAPSFLPYQVMLQNDMPYSELSLELVLLQVILPALLEQGHLRNWLKFSVRSWCIGVSYILDIRSYLLGDVNIDDQPGSSSNVPAPAGQGDANNPEGGFQPGALAAAHQALFQPVSPSMFQPYRRPKFLPFKIVCLIFFICISLTLGSLVIFTVPVYIGRKVMAMWLGNNKIHELYTFGCGMYVCWLGLRVTTLLWSWIPKGWASISKKLKELCSIAFKLLCAMSMLLVVIPVLMGLTLDMIITVPLRVAHNQTPLISLWQDWAIGVLLTKTFFAIVLVGPDWWMKRIIEQVYLGGFRNINLKVIFMDLSLPIVMVLGLSLSVPYIVACSIIPMFSSNFEIQNTVLRRIYPALLGFYVLYEAIVFHVRQFRRMYEHIRNDKYLVGKRLVNYEHRKLQDASQPKEEVSAAS